MTRKLSFLLGLFLLANLGFAQISTLPYTQSFTDEFTTGLNTVFLPSWTGNEVTETSRIFRDAVVFNSAPAAMAVIPTGSFDGQVVVDLNLLNYSNAVVTFVAKSMANGTGTRPSKLEMSTSIDDGATWFEVTLVNEFPNANQDNFATFNYNLPVNTNAVPNVKVRFSFLTGSGGSGTRAKVIVDDVVITGDEGVSNDPVLTINPSELAFSQILGAPSDVQSVNVFGANLTTDVVFNVTAPFEVATSVDGVYGLVQTLSPDNGDLNTQLYVRLNSLVTGDFTSSLASLTTDLLVLPTVALSGNTSNSLVTNPIPFDLSTGNYEFTSWSSEASAGTYPTSMIFWTHATTDPDFNVSFVEDYACLYNLGNRSRIFGEGDNGVSFVNTGNAQFVGVCDGSDPTQAAGDAIANGRNGATILALNTLGRQNINVQWTGRTIAPNNRVYALRLQYRIGDGNGNPNLNWMDFETINEYLANAEAGHFENLSVTLPEEANNQVVVQLRWVYAQHETNTASGSRAHLALDDIIVSTDLLLSNNNFELNNALKMYPNPASEVVYFNKEVSLQVVDMTGKIVLSASKTQSINIQGLSKGVYFVKTTEGDTKKLLVN